MRSTRFLGLVCLAALACRGGEGEQAAPATSAAPATNVTPAAVPAAAPVAGAIEARWLQDADGNAIPDFIESELGFDPRADDCALRGGCGPGAAGSALDAASNTLLVLDASGSMAARLGGATKLAVATATLRRFVAGVPPAVRVGFLVYGHRGDNSPAGKAASCVGADLLLPLGPADAARFGAVLDRFHPTGWTPIARALEQAGAALAGAPAGANRVVMVSDGVETCGGDPAAVARSLRAAGTAVRVDVIGFGVSSADAAALRRIAEAGGGEYFDARTQAALDAYFTRQLAALARNLEASNCERSRYNDAYLCDGPLVNGALARVGTAIAGARAARDAEAVSAYMGLRARIMATDRERRAARRGALDRARLLDTQTRRMHEQLRDARARVQPRPPAR